VPLPAIFRTLIVVVAVILVLLALVQKLGGLRL
jgi:hypothetical protein